MVNKKTGIIEIYGIAGAKTHGKDTLASFILSFSKSFKVIHFADKLKQLAQLVFGLAENQLTDPLLKDSQLQTPIIMDLYLEKIQRETGLNVRPHNKIASSPRELLQFLGTEYIKSEKDDYWVDIIRRKIINSPNKKRFIIPDLRFTNEELLIRELGGKIIKVIRIDLPNNNDKHASENTDLINPDLTLGFITGNFNLHKKVAKLIALNKFDNALKYDYFKALKAISAYTAGESLETSVKLLKDNSRDPTTLRNLLEYYSVPIRKASYNKIPHKVIDNIEYKCCSSGCKTFKPLTEFNFSVKSWDNLHSFCRICAHEYNKKRYILYEKEFDLKSLYKLFKKNASYRNISFDLTFEELNNLFIKQNGKCFYTDEKMTLHHGGPFKISIDRVDSSKGYTINNIVLCCKFVNIMKSNYSLEEFKKYIMLINNNFINKESNIVDIKSTQLEFNW